VPLVQEVALILTDRTGGGLNYVFRLASDDGSLLWIDGKFLVNNDGVHTVTSKSNTVTLDKGLHKIRVFYFQSARPDVALQLFVTVPGAAEQLWSPEL